MNNNVMPNLFVAGAPKCGTTSFVDALSQHPDIYVGKKEPRFFDAPVYFDFKEDYPHKNLDSYLSLYANKMACSARYRVDGSVFNMYNPEGIREILSLEPDAKFIVILRDPVEAAQSMHSQRLKYVEKTMREVSSDFKECWSLLEKRKHGIGFPEGCRNKNLFRYDFLYDYSAHIPSLKKIIPPNQLLFLDYREYKNNPNKFYKKTFDYLGLEEVNVRAEVVNPSYSAKDNFRNNAVSSFQRLLVKLPFRPNKLVQLAKKLISIASDKEELKRLSNEDLQYVADYFERSKKIMEEALEASERKVKRTGELRE